MTIQESEEVAYLQSAGESTPVSKGSLWTGRIISGFVVLFMLFDGATKLMRVPEVVQATVNIGFPASTVLGIGAALLFSTALYVMPQTSILGAIVLTGYLGGATAANVRAGTPMFNTCFPVIFGVLVWLGLFLRDSRLRTLVPLRR